MVNKFVIEVIEKYMSFFGYFSKVLRRFKLTPLWVGLLFGIKDGANSLSSPIWGYFCDKSR
jgi:hypothetical protein